MQTLETGMTVKFKTDGTPGEGWIVRVNRGKDKDGKPVIVSALVQLFNDGPAINTTVTADRIIPPIAAETPKPAE